MADFKLTHLASGDLLRQQISTGTEAGKQAKDYITKGQLVPDSLMVDLISQELKKIESSWLLDGMKIQLCLFFFFFENELQ